jgi:hypothetical protein
MAALSVVLCGQQPVAIASATIKVLPIDPSSRTVLMGGDASLKGNLKEQWPGQAARFWVYNWTSREDAMTWTVRAPKAGNYSVALLILNCGKILINCTLPSPPAVKVEVAGASNRLTETVAYRKASMTNEWVRDELPGTLHLPAGESKITVRALANPGEAFNLALFSLELTQPKIKKQMDERAAKVRSPTAWMVDAKYGLMFTWTAASQPRTGPQKSYEQAVNDFDVNAFADMVQGTGAGFIVFATSWSTYYFPAPIQTIERVVPGHTTKRDLIRELADALNARGIKLMIYYHAGRAQADWWSGPVAQTMDRADYFNEWESTIREIGLRYGDKLAGFWFDDGTTFYYTLQAPWEEMTAAVKAGYPARVVGYNSWILPKATDFQDFACGEGGFADRLADDPELPVGGNGIFLSGPQKGLQAALTTTMEPGNWGHVTPNTPVPPPQYSADQMIGYLKTAMARKLVPVINLEVYQDGSAAPATIEEFKAIKSAIEPTMR